MTDLINGCVFETKTIVTDQVLQNVAQRNYFIKLPNCVSKSLEQLIAEKLNKVEVHFEN